jgi:signal transduction histidine kinase
VLRKENPRSFSYHEEAPQPKDAPFLHILQSHIESSLRNALLDKELRDSAALLQQKVRERTRDLERTNQELQDFQEKMIRSEKLAAIGQLAASVGHELRNPLGAIRNSIFYLKDALKGQKLLEEDPAMKEMIDLADQEAVSAARILSDLLDFSRVVRLEPREADINALLRATLRRFNFTPRVELLEEYAELPPTLIDAQKMQQVINNLVINALQAMNTQGRLSVSTRLVPGDADAWVMMSFKDTGSGIDPKNLARIFDPLFTTKAKGTGLGLAISLGIVEAHGGKIDVDSSPHGSTFSVRWPLRRAA